MRRLIFSLVMIMILMIQPGLMRAQTGDFPPYAWEAADLALVYPAGWDEPAAAADGETLRLTLAQTLAAAPEVRPPGVPMIALVAQPGGIENGDLTGPLAAALAALGVDAVAASPRALAGLPAAAAQGLSADGSLFGLGRAALLPDGSLLTVSGRAPTAQREDFTRLFDIIADSLVIGAATEPAGPEYGALWQTIRTLADGEAAFVDVTALAYYEGRLYAADAAAGLIVLDAAAGTVSEQHPNADMAGPAALAVGADGTVYIADTLCQCVFRFQEGDWAPPIGGFGAGAPFALAALPDGRVYAADVAETGLIVRLLPDGGVIALPPDMIQPILLAGAGGRLLALGLDGRLWALQDETFTPVTDLNAPNLVITGAAMEASGRLIVAGADAGLLLFGGDGEVLRVIGQPLADTLRLPLPGQIASARALAAAPDGTLFFAAAGADFGVITAMSLQVEAGRVGKKALTAGVLVRGVLTAELPAQEWTLTGTAGQTAVITAAADDPGALDVALRVIAPDGSETAFNDDGDSADILNPTDAQISAALPLAGVYTVRVERVDGGGSYSLGVAVEQRFVLSPSGVTRLRGTISAALPFTRWLFDGQAGQVFTLTLRAEGGTLDPLLRLLDERGRVLAENDDAADSALGKDAQIVQFRLPRDGLYAIETRRFDGEGGYELVIVATS